MQVITQVIAGYLGLPSKYVTESKSNKNLKYRDDGSLSGSVAVIHGQWRISSYRTDTPQSINGQKFVTVD